MVLSSPETDLILARSSTALTALIAGTAVHVPALAGETPPLHRRGRDRSSRLADPNPRQNPDGSKVAPRMAMPQAEKQKAKPSRKPQAKAQAKTPKTPAKASAKPPAKAASAAKQAADRTKPETSADMPTAKKSGRGAAREKGGKAEPN